jgi:hypothetical protein
MDRRKGSVTALPPASRWLASSGETSPQVFGSKLLGSELKPMIRLDVYQFFGVSRVPTSMYSGCFASSESGICGLRNISTFGQLWQQPF